MLYRRGYVLLSLPTTVFACLMPLFSFIMQGMGEMDFQIALGGVDIGIHCKYATIQKHFSEFLTERKKPRYLLSAGPTDILQEWRQSFWYDGDDDSIRCIGFEPLFERQAITRRILEQLLNCSAMLMHGAVICDGRYAYMFTAPSGTGKSTRARLFVENHPESFVLNGDKPIIRVEENRVMAYGSPWKGKEGWGINAEYPLKAIFMLERAENTCIVPLNISTAFDCLVRQVYMPSETHGVLQTIRLLKALEGKVKLFRFYSPATIEAVEAAYRTANAK